MGMNHRKDGVEFGSMGKRVVEVGRKWLIIIKLLRWGIYESIVHIFSIIVHELWYVGLDLIVKLRILW